MWIKINGDKLPQGIVITQNSKTGEILVGVVNKTINIYPDKSKQLFGKFICESDHDDYWTGKPIHLFPDYYMELSELLNLPKQS